MTLALIGIFFLTLFPFRISFHVLHPIPSSPFLLGGSGKDAGLRNAFLNVLLFIPFGFGLSEKLRERGKSRAVALVVCLLVGALLSYTIEFLQLYIPSRDSGWYDVFTNASGSLLGCFLFILFGAPLVRRVEQAEAALAGTFTLTRAALLISVYLAVWFAISGFLQTETRISDWSPQSVLAIGNDAPGKPVTAWKGQVFHLDFWDHALPRETARAFTAEESLQAPAAVPQAEYDFSVSPFQDRLHLLPPLARTAEVLAPAASTSGVSLDSASWLISSAPVAPLISALQKNNQFTIRVVCAPAEIAGSDGRIVAISRPSGLPDLQIRQDDSDLVLWFRNPLSVRRALLAWYVPKIFATTARRNILFSYDGSVVSLYIDGGAPRQYRLGPGTALARLFRMVKPSELNGYNDVYYFLVFFPAGALLGLAAHSIGLQRAACFQFAAVGLLIPPILLEATLVFTSGRSISPRNLAFSVVLLAAGWLWITADNWTSGKFSLSRRESFVSPPDVEKKH